MEDRAGGRGKAREPVRRNLDRLEVRAIFGRGATLKMLTNPLGLAPRCGVVTFAR